MPRGARHGTAAQACGNAALSQQAFLLKRAEKNLYTPPCRPYLPLSRTFRGGFCWFEQRLVQPTGGGPMRWKDTLLLLP
jgi:hypothetical protein